VIPVVFCGGFDLGVALALVISAVVYVQHSRTTTDALTDVMERLRHPVRWTLRNPVRAASRVRIF
jgi:hypothetical protein